MAHEFEVDEFFNDRPWLVEYSIDDRVSWMALEDEEQHATESDAIDCAARWAARDDNDLTHIRVREHYSGRVTLELSCAMVRDFVRLLDAALR